ncbi:MAG: hypothetical protein J7J31_00045 [Helicobacteraceae bacterium]|nr:hypothetical protein [Helicobacteraceae bacterium]
MLNKTIWIITFLFLMVQGVLGQSFDPTADVIDNWESDYSEELTDQRVHNTSLSEVEESNSDSTYKETWEGNRAGKVGEETKFFQNVEMPHCEVPNDYVCPPLVEVKAKEGYRTRLDSVDLTTGRISCSVLQPVSGFSTLTQNTESRVLHNQSFVNQACVQKYSKSNPENKDTNEDIERLKQENALFLEELQQQEFKYTVDYKKSGDDEFLDLADILDGLVSFNPEIFNLEETLLTRDLKTRTGYTTLPNDTIVEKLNSSLKSFSDIWDGDGWSEDRFYQVERGARIRDASAAVANSSYFMLLDFWLKSGDLINDIALALAFIIVFFNTVSTWAMPSITAKMANLQHHRENSLHRGFAGGFLLVLLFTGEVEKLNIEYESKSEGLIKSEIIVQQSNLQALVQLLYSETNWAADSFTEISIRSFLNSMNSSTGLFDAAQIDALATEAIILEKESEKLKVIDLEMCAANFDLKVSEDLLRRYRTSTLEEFEGDSRLISSLGYNPYPKSEREAQAMMGKSLVSPYNSSSSNYDSGVVEKDAMQFFRAADYSPLSLSGCYYNKKKMISNDSRLKEIEKQLEMAKSTVQKQAKVEYLKLINEIQWSLFAKLGYLSISFLPATSMLIDDIGIIGDLEKTERGIDDAVAAKDEDMITELSADALKSISEDIPYLTMLGGYQLAKLIHPLKNKIIDGAIDKFGKASAVATLGTSVVASRALIIARKLKVGKNGDEIDILDVQIAAMIIKSIFKSLIITTLIVGSLMLFLLLFIEKLFAFISSIFLIIFAFSKNQEERITAAIGKIMVVAFKTVLIVICVFLGLYSFSLVNTFEMIFVEHFFNSMDSIENASWAYKIAEFDVSNIMTMIGLFFQKYIFYGVAKFSFMILKLALAVQLMWKMPNYIVELIYERIHGVSDSVGESLQAATQQHVARV